MPDGISDIRTTDIEIDQTDTTAGTTITIVVPTMAVTEAAITRPVSVSIMDGNPYF